MQLKIHQSGDREVIAVADTNVIGKTFHDNKRQIVVSESFYKGEEKSEKEVIAIISQADNINLIGKEAVAAGLKAKIIVKENIIVIQGIPYAQAFTC